MRVVSFEPSLRGALETSCKNQVAVSMVNCKVKPAIKGSIDDLEIMATNHSKVDISPRKFPDLMKSTVGGPG